MPNIIWEEGDDILTTHGGLGVVGALFGSLPLGNQLNASTVPGAENPDISNRDIVAAYLGLLVQGKNDFDHIEAFRDDQFYSLSLGLKNVPSSPTLRQRLDQAAAHMEDTHWQSAIEDSAMLLLERHASFQPIRIGKQEYIPLDIDVSPFDNGKTKKEGVSRTYKGCDGFAPIFGYLGHEGYALGAELREGKQHSQKNTPAFLKGCIVKSRRIVPEARILVRLDSGNDSTDNIDICQAGGVDFLIKRNLRKESVEAWLDRAKQEGKAECPRDGKTIYRGSCNLSPREGHDPIRVVYEVVERTITAKGQRLFVPDIEVATYWTSLPDEPPDILPWYSDHGTMEQYHSEYKTDLDLERLPSGKFATNQLVLQLALLAFNILRIMDQATLGDPAVPLRKPAQRRRLRTVIQNLITCAAKLVAHARQRRARYGHGNPWGEVLGHLYAQFAFT